MKFQEKFEDACLQLNAVEGFNPTLYLQPSNTEDKGSEVTYTLPLDQQKTWFRIKYPQGQVSKRVLAKNDKQFGVEVRLFPSIPDSNDKYLAIGLAFAEPGKFDLTEIEHKALAMALSEAGFGIQFHALPATAICPQEEVSPVTEEAVPLATGKAGETSSADSSVVLSEPEESQSPESQEEASESTNALTSESDTTAEDNTQVEEPSDESELEEITLEDAKKMVIPCGIHAGKTLEQLGIEKPAALAWFASNYEGDYILKRGAQCLLKAAGVPC